MFRIGETNEWVKPGDHVWTDRVVLKGYSLYGTPVIEYEPVHGRVMNNGNVLLDSMLIVELRNCRITEKVIRV